MIVAIVDDASTFVASDDCCCDDGSGESSVLIVKTPVSVVTTTGASPFVSEHNTFFATPFSSSASPLIIFSLSPVSC